MKSALEYAKETFYERLKDLEIESAEISSFLKSEPLENTNFFELCNSYTRIALKAPRYRVEGTCDLIGDFQTTEVDNAKYATSNYVKAHHLSDFKGLLSVIEEMHRYSAKPEDGQTSGMIMSERGGFGMYYNLAEIPDKIWEDVSVQVLHFLEGK